MESKPEFLMVPNWREYQHYGNRTPPWIKLHKEIINSARFQQMSDKNRANLIQIWVLASEYNNQIINNAEWIRGKIGATSRVDLKGLIEKGWLVPWVEDASKTLAPALAKRKQNACLELDIELDTDKENIILHGASKNEASVPEQTKPQKPEDTTPVLVEFECNGDVKTYRFTEKKLAEYQDLFPSLDILQEVKRAKQWIVDNSSRRKTARGMPRFLNSWLGRANDRFRPTANSPNGTPTAPAVSWKAQNEADRLAEEQRVAKSLIEDMRRNEERLAQYRQP